MLGWLRLRAALCLDPDIVNRPFVPDIPHSSNAPGDFYVENECCTSCGIPIDIAPGLFAWEEPELPVTCSNHCYICNQPNTPEQLDKMMEVMATQELGCIRYGGKDPAMIERIRKESGEGFCDEQIPQP